MAQIVAEKNHIVFVYGTLKFGERAHQKLQGMDFQFVGRTPPMFQMTGRGFPMIFKSDKGFQVQGEVYHVNDDVLAALDAYEGYPTFYDRMEIPIMDVNNPDHEAVTAWIYYIPKDSGHHGDGVWRLPVNGALDWSPS